MANVTDFQVFKLVGADVCPVVYNDVLTQLRKEHPTMPIIKAVVAAAQAAEGMTICKTCSKPVKKGGRWVGCCDSLCYRDAYQ